MASLLESEMTVLSRCIRCGELNGSDEKKIMVTLNYPEGMLTRTLEMFAHHNRCGGSSHAGETIDLLH